METVTPIENAEVVIALIAQEKEKAKRCAIADFVVSVSDLSMRVFDQLCMHYGMIPKAKQSIPGLPYWRLTFDIVPNLTVELRSVRLEESFK